MQWPRWLGGKATEERSAIDFKDLLVDPVHAGVSVTETSAVNLPAVYRCVNLNAETIASLPVDVYAKRGNRRVPYTEPIWLRSPNDLQTLGQFIAASQVSLDIDGNCFWLKASDRTGRLAGLTVLPPEAVHPKLVDLGNGPVVVYDLQTVERMETLAASAVVHLRSVALPGQLRGLSPIACARQTIGIGLAAEQYGAQFFGSGASLSGLVEVPGSVTKEVAERLAEQFQKRHGGVSKSFAIGVITGGGKWVPMSVKPDEAQFLQSRRYTATEIANLFGCPPELVTDVEGAKGYVTALSARLRLWYLTGLLPRITRLEVALSSLLPSPAYVKFNTNALLRMDPEQRTAFYQAAQLGQWMTRNEIRALEDMDPMTGGDEPLKSVQWQENRPPGATGTDATGTAA